MFVVGMTPGLMAILEQTIEGIHPADVPLKSFGITGARMSWTFHRIKDPFMLFSRTFGERALYRCFLIFCQSVSFGAALQSSTISPIGCPNLSNSMTSMAGWPWPCW
jgi:hypothetical protein